MDKNRNRETNKQANKQKQVAISQEAKSNQNFTSHDITNSKP